MLFNYSKLIIVNHSNPHNWFPAFLICILLSVCQSVSADNPETIQPVETIREKAHSYLSTMTEQESSRVWIDIGQMDPRLNLPLCEQAIEMKVAPETDSVLTGHLLEVRCPIPHWKLFLPYQIKLLNKVVVTRHPIALGTLLKAEDLQLKEIDTLKLFQATFDDPKALVGFVAKRTLRSGEVLSSNVIESRKLIRRNQKILAVASMPGLNVTAEAIALSDGKMGDWIQARNTHSQRIVEGKVESEGRISINP